MAKEPKNPGKSDPKSATKPQEKTEFPAKYKYNKRAFGRPSKYRPSFCFELIKYFDREHTEEYEETHTNRKGETWSCFKLRAVPVPMFEGFCAKFMLDRHTLMAWVGSFKDFSTAYSRAQELQMAHLSTVTGLGLYNSNWAVFMAKNVSKWRDKRDIEHSGQVDSSVFVSQMASMAEQAERDEAEIFNRN